MIKMDLMRTTTPFMWVAQTIGDDSRAWWEAIGRSIMAFNEVEQGVIDWAVQFSQDASLWQKHFGKDLKALTPILRRILRRTGPSKLRVETMQACHDAIAGLDALIPDRNYVAHMRLRFHDVPLDGTDEDWISTASHVEGCIHDERGPVLEYRDLAWLQGTIANAHSAAAAFQDAMLAARAEMTHTQPIEASTRPQSI
jgi:hypothetical protein